MRQRSARRFKKLRNQRGLALLSVLWVVTLLSVIAASFAVSTRTEINVVFNQIENARAEAIADAGVHRVIMGLMTNDPEQAWRTDGTIYSWRYGGGELRATAQDEGGKIDLNRAGEELLTDLFLAAGLGGAEASALTDAVIDFRDQNEDRRLNGAEEGDYEAAGLPYGPKDGPFESLDELRQVLGMTPALFEMVAPSLTVHSRLRRPHEATAPPLVVEALTGLSDADDAEDTGEGGAEAEDSEGERTEEGGEAAQSASEEELLEDPLELTESPQPLGDTGAVPRSRARVFTVHVESRLESGAIFARDAIVNLAGGEPEGFEFLFWQQGSRELFPEDAAPE